MDAFFVNHRIKNNITTKYHEKSYQTCLTYSGAERIRIDPDWYDFGSAVSIQVTSVYMKPLRKINLRFVCLNVFFPHG